MRRLKTLTAALGLALALPSGAGELPPEVARVLADMQARLDRLEARNAELERQAGAPSATLEKRVKQLEETNAKLEEAIASERLSQDEPEIVTRLKAVEFQALGMQQQARMMEALEGITAGVSFTTVAQRVNGGATTAVKAESQLSWRGDAQVSLPGGTLGLSEGGLFFHFRMGQGDGLSNLNPTFSAPNATAFQLGGAGQPDDASPILAQAWYQLNTPLDGKLLDQAREHMEINFGKIDPFLFFDQNANADDETVQFMNLAFVHNPLLDAGGQAGLDAYGFTPGLRLAYVNETDGPEPWGISLGVFGSGSGAAFSDSLKQPFVIVQADTVKRFGGLAGNYRAYLWRNGRATHHDGVTEEDQSGWGISVDQQVADSVSVWARYGHGMDGNPVFDQALALGAELTGDAWGRGADSLGLGLGWLSASDSYKAANAGISGAEQLAELYYRWRVNSQFELSPDYQFIHRPGADPSKDDAHILGLRAQLTF